MRDPRDIRALAHPARMAILDALASGEELTATECAEFTGLSPSATAYHLKLLQRYGFAEPAPARSDGRERPWRASNRSRSMDLDTSTAGGAAAAWEVTAAYIDRTKAVAEEFVAGEHREPPEWQDVGSLSNSDIWLSAEEARAVNSALQEVLHPFRARSLKERPEGTRRVRVMNLVFPHPRRPPGRG